MLSKTAKMCNRKMSVTTKIFQITKKSRRDSITWPDWIHEAWRKKNNEKNSLYPSKFPKSDGKDKLKINSLNGTHLIKWNDCVILDIWGNIYPE